MSTKGLNRREFLRVAGLTSVGLVAAACSPAVAPTTGPGTPGAQKKETVLKVAVEDFFGDHLDPLAAPAAGTAWLLLHFYDSIIQVSPGGKIVPAVAKSWEVSADKLTWTFRIRDDVYFHDGVNADGTVEPRRKLTAEDVAFSIVEAASPRNNSAEKITRLLGKNPVIDVPDQNTIVIRTLTPSAFLLTSFADTSLYVFPKAYITKNGYAYFDRHPITTGVYKFVRLSPGDLIEFVATDYTHWSGLVPDFNRVIVYLVPEEATRAAMLEKGMIDEAALSIENALALKAKGYAVVQGGPSAEGFEMVGTFTPEGKKSPFGDIRVREAMSLAINRQELIDTMFRGFAKMPAPARQSWENEDFAYFPPEMLKKWKDWVANAYRYDPVAAKRLLTEAGFANGFSGTIVTAPDAEVSYIQDVAVACTGYWEKIGARITVQSVENAIFSKMRHQPESMELVGKIAADGGRIPKEPLVSKFDRYSSKYGPWNFFYGNPELEAKVDKLYDAIQNEFDGGKRAVLYDQLLELTLSTWVNFNVIQAQETFVFSPRVEPYLPPPVKNISYFYKNWKYTGKEK